MRITYFRKTKITKEKIIENLKKYAENNKIEIWGIKEINNITLVAIYDKNLFETYKNINPELLAVLPMIIFIVNEGEINKVGILNPEILGSIADLQEISDVENKLKKLVDEISEAEERKIKKIKVYATTNCPYCKAEKEYLDSKGIKYEYTLVDLNPVSAQEMIEKTGQYGVPVTEIIFDDEDAEYIIGFDRERIEKILQNYQIEIV
ncbi:MAG: glutaredoxin family protein [Minisyncoccia bacterium]|jgi:glutaredoxin